MMKVNKWLLGSVASLIVASVSLSTVAVDDDRNLIVLRPKEERLMLQDMRNYLHGIQIINESLAANDLVAVEKAARDLGKIAIYDVRPVMSQNLVPKFRKMAESVHEDFESLANMAKDQKPVNEMLGHLGEMMQTCVNCHETFRVGTFAHDDK